MCPGSPVAHRADCRLTTGEEPEHVGLEHLAHVRGQRGDRFRNPHPNPLPQGERGRTFAAVTFGLQMSEISSHLGTRPK